VIVNLCEGFGGHTAGEAHLAGLLELLGVPYTGSPPECLALVHDKARTKWLLSGAGLPTAPFVRVQPGEPLPEQPLATWLERGPLFVKPAAEDASLGIGSDSVVVDWTALARQAQRISTQYGPVLIEPFIDGREFNVGVMALQKGELQKGVRNRSACESDGTAAMSDHKTVPDTFCPPSECLPLAEIEFRTGPGLRWPIVTYEGKWSVESRAYVGTPVCCPATVAPALADSIRSAALAAFRVTGCRDYARVDLRVDHSGNIFILEVNANPDVGPNAGFNGALLAAGIAYAEFVERLVATASARGAALKSRYSDA
jgi:D-alanine-D-alanine ligase